MRALVCTGLLFFASPGVAQDDLERTAQALSIVERAADVLGGGDRLRALEALRYRFDGPAQFTFQGPSPDEPGEFQYVIDFARSYEEQRANLMVGFARGPSVFENTRYLDLTSVDDASEAARQARLSPHAVLKAFLDAPATVSLISRSADEDVVAGILGAQLVRAHIDAQTGILERVSWPINDLRRGDAFGQAIFNGYSEADGWLVPGRVRYEEADALILDLPFEIYSLGVEAQPARPPEAEAAAGPGPTRGSPPSESQAFGEGVVALYDVAGPDYHALAVRTPDGVVLIEAPGSIPDGLALAERASQALGAPVVLVAATHHHGDHSGGFAGAVAHGADAIVAEGHAQFFADMATAARSFVPLSFEPRQDIDHISVPAGGKREIEGRIVAYDVGNTHSREHLVFLVTDSGVLFQSDMAVFLWDGSVEAARDQACTLLGYIEAHDLPVETIVGGHGRPGTVEDLRAAVALRETPCPSESPLIHQ